MARRSLLESVVLGFVAERPGYGYDLGKRIDARMGPGWQFNPSGLYQALRRLEERHLVVPEVREARAPRNRERVIYHATEDGVLDVEQWLGSPVRKEPVREDVLARIAVSRPEHAPLIIDALKDYERECLEMVGGTNEHYSGDVTPWERLIAKGVQDSILQHLEAELHWVKLMRRRIEAFGATNSA